MTKDDRKQTPQKLRPRDDNLLSFRDPEEKQQSIIIPHEFLPQLTTLAICQTHGPPKVDE